MSSSGSWSAGRAPPDIIDLDKLMRGAVRPPRPEPHLVRCDQLVVDAGGADRKPALASSSSGSRGRRAERTSRDSGLSDGSYARTEHRTHRRAPAGDNRAVRASRAPTGSSNSLRAFRAVCERALLDQQAQIARVAQLCERLAERPPPPPPRRRSERSATPDTSDVSSSSRSTGDLRRKDKHRTEECKTYKIIMNKLDKLNRLFAARAPPAPAPAAPSSGSVSVCDKLVATEPERCVLQVDHNTVTCHMAQSCRGTCAGRGSRGGPGGGRAGLRAVPNTCALDIAPGDALPAAQRHNIAIESVVQCESGAGSAASAGDPRCGFGLDDPVHLYSQSKRLQAMPASSRRARSREPSERAEQRSRARPASLCARCAGCWRAVADYVAAQVYRYPDTACH